MINKKIQLTNGKMAVILKYGDDRVLVALENGDIIWISPKQIQGEAQ